MASSSSSSFPMSVTEVQIEGRERTREDFIVSELEGLKTAKTLDEVRQVLVPALANLESYGIFKKVTFTLESQLEAAARRRAPRSASTTSSTSTPPPPPPSLSPIISLAPPSPPTVSALPSDTNASLFISLEERPWFGARTEVSQEAHTGEQSFKTSALLRNLFGRGERIEMSSQYGSMDSTAFSLSLTKPKLFNRSWLRGHWGIFSNSQNHTRTSSCFEHARGTNVSVSDRSGEHEVGYEWSWRDLFPLTRSLTGDEVRANTYLGPSESIVQDCVPSVKSAVRYAFTRDRLDSRFVPTAGTFTQFSTELAGLGGDAHFVKVQSDLKFYLPLTRSLSFNASLLSGLMFPLGGPMATGKPTYLSDRFFFGTPLIMRGFEQWSVGPIDHEDQLGGEVMSSGAVSLSWAGFGAMQRAGIRLHAFANAGNLVSLNAVSPRATFEELLRTARVSVGAGLVIPTPLGRLEFNATQPVRKEATDRTRNFQFGLGWQFV